MGYCTSSKDSYASRITGAGYGGAHSLFQFRGEPPIQAYSTIYLFSVALASGVVTVLPLVQVPAPVTLKMNAVNVVVMVLMKVPVTVMET